MPHTNFVSSIRNTRDQPLIELNNKQHFFRNFNKQQLLFFPQHNVESPGRDRACRHCWISSFWTPSGKRRLHFSRGPLFNPTGSTFFDFHKHNKKCVCVCLICLPPGRRLLLTPGMGMGGTIWDHLGTILGPLMPANSDFQPKKDFLEMADTYFVSSIW